MAGHAEHIYTGYFNQNSMNTVLHDTYDTTSAINTQDECNRAQVEGYYQQPLSLYPNTGMKETSQPEGYRLPQAGNLRGYRTDLQAVMSAAPQPSIPDLAERVSSMTFGAGGPLSMSEPLPYPTDHVPENGTNVTDVESNQSGTVDPLGYPDFSDGCINPQLTFNVVDYDEHQDGLQRLVPMSIDNSNVWTHGSTVGSPDGNTGYAEALDTTPGLEEPVLRPAPLFQHQAWYEEMMADMSPSSAPTPMMTELCDVPFAERGISSQPWSHAAATARRMHHNSYDDNLTHRYLHPSQGTTPSSDHYRGWRSMSDVGYTKTSMTSGDPHVCGVVADKANQQPFPFDKTSFYHQVHRHQYTGQTASAIVQGAPAAESYADMSIDSSPGNPRTKLGLQIVDRRASVGSFLSAPENLTSNNDAPSPAPSEISIAPSLGGTSLLCSVTGCRASYSGEYQRGNLARHMRRKHRQPVLECEVLSCGKFFQRQDARLKHYRKEHASVLPWLKPPVPRKKKSSE